MDRKESPQRAYAHQRLRVNRLIPELPPYEQNTQSTQTFLNWREGLKNPHYKERIKSGLQAGTPMSGETVTYQKGYYTYGVDSYFISSGLKRTEATYDGTPLTGHLSYVGGSPNTPSESEANQQALTEFVRAIRRAQTTFQGGVFIGELAQTIRQIKRPARALQGGFRDYLNTAQKRVFGTSRFPSRKKALEIVGDTWLEYSFGWKPLLNDIDDGAKALAERIITRPAIRRVFGYGEARNDLNIIGAFVPGGSGYKATETHTKRVQQKLYGAVGASGIYAPGTNLTHQTLGLDLSNFIPTLWELIPYSFLIDYFTNIGDIVSAATLNTSSLRWAMTVTIKESVVNYNNWYLPELHDGVNTHDEYVFQAPGRLVVTYRRVDRSLILGSLVPSLDISIPTSPGKWFNLAALSVASKRLSKKLLKL